MKTAMQELIDLIYSGKLNSLLDVLAEAHLLKEKEKEQMNQSYIYGSDWGTCNPQEVYNDYYEETYKK
jgi:hypothetical protein